MPLALEDKAGGLFKIWLLRVVFLFFAASKRTEQSAIRASSPTVREGSLKY